MGVVGGLPFTRVGACGVRTVWSVLPGLLKPQAACPSLSCTQTAARVRSRPWLEGTCGRSCHPLPCCAQALEARLTSCSLFCFPAQLSPADVHKAQSLGGVSSPGAKKTAEQATHGAGIRLPGPLRLWPCSEGTTPLKTSRKEVRG